jgi:hypothetical protein
MCSKDQLESMSGMTGSVTINVLPVLVEFSSRKRAAVRFGNPARDGQAQTGTAALLLICTGARFVYAVEALKDMRLRRRRNANAVSATLS